MYSFDHCTYEDGTWSSYESTYSQGETYSYNSTNCWGNGNSVDCSECVGGYDANWNWTEDCKPTGPNGEDVEEEELSPEQALEEALHEVEEASWACGCGDDEDADFGKLTFF